MTETMTDTLSIARASTGSRQRQRQGVPADRENFERVEKFLEYTPLTVITPEFQQITLRGFFTISMSTGLTRSTIFVRRSSHCFRGACGSAALFHYEPAWYLGKKSMAPQRGEHSKKKHKPTM